jgi:hypothetical protein
MQTDEFYVEDIDAWVAVSFFWRAPRKRCAVTGRLLDPPEEGELDMRSVVYRDTGAPVTDDALPTIEDTLYNRLEEE